MSEASTPRQMVNALLQNATPSRPLLMPVIFSLGARLQNLSLQQFLANPTRIVNALRQIRSVLKVDGLTCYFDPLVEAEALGCKREWHADGSCTIASPSFLSVNELREQLRPADSLSGAGYIPVACEVLRRLKTMMKDEPALMVRVTGPLSLAVRLSGGQVESPISSPPRDLVEFAAVVVASASKSFAEAGADIILLSEDFLPDMSSETCDWYGSLLTPIANVIRFYEALPVVWWGTTSAESLTALLERSWNCAWCPLQTPELLARGSVSHSKQGWIGLSLPPDAFCGDRAYLDGLPMLPGSLPNPKLGLLTSAEDVATTVDVKHLARGLDAIRERFGLERSIHETLAQSG
jgi:hypothetical protein